ncbi:hypothetical protein LUZ60_006035 [Juncus effusus]|nr:hypothetical protein LUZ60_006035 [Juncus effusus]
MFAFTSSGAKVDEHTSRSSGPYVYRIHGENYHLMGSLVPTDGCSPQFAQLYVYDTENEIDNRVRVLGKSKIDPHIEKNVVHQFVQMLDENNGLVKIFRMARDRFRNTYCITLGIRLVSSRENNGLQYDAPQVDEIAGLIVGDLGCGHPDRDIIVQHKTGRLHRIDMLHPS